MTAFILVIFGIVCVVGAISLTVTMLLPIAVAVAIWFLLKSILDNVMDTSWMTSGVGIAIFVLLLWIII